MRTAGDCSWHITTCDPAGRFQRRPEMRPPCCWNTNRSPGCGMRWWGQRRPHQRRLIGSLDFIKAGLRSAEEASDLHNPGNRPARRPLL